MNRHYVCTGGCGGISMRPSTCASSECPHFGKPLDPCDCTDGTHGWISDAEEREELQKFERYEE